MSCYFGNVSLDNSHAQYKHIKYLEIYYFEKK